MTRKNAFTLAEILVVLAIIGVVASITIPSLIQKTQHQEYVTALKKFYSEANQALALTAIDEGTPGTLSGGDSLQADIAAHFKKAKDCGINHRTTSPDCFAVFKYDYDGSDTDGDSYDVDWSGDNSIITADGISVVWYINYTRCSDNDSDNDAPNSPAYKTCGFMYVDINGLKGPNIAGRDVFEFHITSNKQPLLYTYGIKDNYYWKDNNCNTNNKNGIDCAGRIMDEGWQMNY